MIASSVVPKSWDWETWLPFWTEEETEKYVFEDNYLDFFGPECPPIQSSLEDWPKLKKWAKENNHELILVSAQRKHCEEPTTAWLKEPIALACLAAIKEVPTAAKGKAALIKISSHICIGLYHQNQIFSFWFDFFL